MALIRMVTQHPINKKWGYVEMSDEDASYCVLLGDKEFENEEEAKEYSKGFSSHSYVWVNPLALELENLLASIRNFKGVIGKFEERLMNFQQRL